MEISSTGCPGCTGDPVAPTTAYRVVLWEQPDLDDVPPESIGWGEAAFDLTEVDNVQEVIRWAAEQLASGAGYHSQAGRAVRDREYVVYAKVPGEDLLIQITGWDPSRNARGDNLPRLRRHL
jgi:hypothetical protein